MRPVFVKTIFVVFFLAALALSAPAGAKDLPAAPGQKQLPTAAMIVNFVGDDYIFANERKFLVSTSTVVKNKIGVEISPRLLRLGQKVTIEYHADAKGGLLADSITVSESDEN
jgi:hypothetical protein